MASQGGKKYHVSNSGTLKKLLYELEFTHLNMGIRDPNWEAVVSIKTVTQGLAQLLAQVDQFFLGRVLRPIL